MVFPRKTGLSAAVFFIALIIGQAFADFTLTDKSEVSRFFGTDRVKVVFVSDKKLCFVDFSEANPVVKIIAAASNPCNPVISPQGNLVTFASGKNLASDPPNNAESAAFFCDLLETAKPVLVDTPAFVPRFVQNSAEPTIVYSNSGAKNLPASDYAWNGYGKVYTKNIISGNKTELWSKGSWYGGLSWDGKWLSTAELRKNAFLIDISSAAQPIRLHNLPAKRLSTGKDTVLTFQCCNPSISSSRVFCDAMMYFDAPVDDLFISHLIPGFGNDDGWETHKLLFISRSSGTIVRHYSCPSLSRSRQHGKVFNSVWSYPEWSNHPYYATAALEIARWDTTSGDGIANNERIYAINLKDSIYQPLIRLSDTSFSMLAKKSIQWPWLWVETPANFEKIEDSSWLNKTTSILNHGKKIIKDHGFAIKNGYISSSENTEIRFYSLSGKLLTAEKLAQGGYKVPVNGNSGIVIARSGDRHIRVYRFK